jgi:uncharacterized Tic20 family protein
MSPFQKLLKSRKFLIAVFDLVVSVTLYFVSVLAAPETFEHVKFLIVSIQPVFITLIGAIAYEDGQEWRSGSPRPPAVG